MRRRGGCLFAMWFVFCGVLGLAALTGLGFLGYAAYQWMGRH